MSKLIKLTDEIGNLLQERADKDNVSLAGEVKLLLDGKDDNNINKRLDKMAAYLKSEFADIKSAINDTVIDRMTPASSKLLPSNITWENCIQDVYFDFPDDDTVWLPKVKETWGESDSMDMAEFSSDGSYIYDVTGGEEMPVLKITPALRDYLKGKGFVL